MFLSVGSEDSYRTIQVRRMADALKKAGVDHILAVEQGMGDMVNPNPKVIEQIYTFFDKHLKPPASTQP